MDSKSKAQAFLAKHNFSIEPPAKLHSSIIEDMKKGLLSGNSDQAMINAGSAFMRSINEGENAIVIDAGGTNFRSCLVTKKAGGIEISDFEKASMPGMDKELNKNDFYTAIANNISRLKDCSDKISFCFSYAMEITKDRDGKILRFSKEIKAPEAVGTYLGKELLCELKKKGWKKIHKINVLNDTAALLLSSYVEHSEKKWNSHLAFILGTGMNSAYIDHARVIVTECGMFSHLPQSDFDIIVSGRTTQPQQSLLEKMCSGAYLGDLAFEMLLKACFEGYFSDNFAKATGRLSNITTADFDGIFDKEKSSTLTELLKHGTKEDALLLKELITAIILRSANLSAAVIYAAAICSDKKKGELPLCIACNGSTFWKTPLLKAAVESRLKDLLYQSFEIIKIDDDITKGSFAAAFIA